MLSVETILDAFCCSSDCEPWDPISSGYQQEIKDNHANNLEEYPITGCQVKADIEHYCQPLGYVFE